MRRTISLIDEENAFARRLCDYINSREDAYIKAVPNDTSPDIFKVSFSRDRFLEEDAAVKIYKFQSADKLMRDILKVYDEAGTEKIKKLSTGKAKIRGIYSPINRCGKTAFAITTGLVLGSDEKTLLVSFDEYEGIFKLIAQEAISDLSDVIYAYKKRDFFWNRLVQSIYQFGTLSYIPPVRFPQDLGEMSTEELKDLIVKLSGEGGFGNLIIDFGAFGRKIFDLLEICDEIWMPVLNDKLSELKVKEFMENANLSGYEDVAEKVQRLELPFEKGSALAVNEEDYTHGELYEYTGNLFKASEETDG